MRRIFLASAAVIAFFCFWTRSTTMAQEGKDDTAAQTGAVPSYPESVEGLKSLVQDIFEAIKSGNVSTKSPYFWSLVIPDHSAWFAKTFGPVEGPRLEAKYEQLLPQPASDIQRHFDYALKGERTNVEVSLITQPLDPNARMNLAILDAMVRPISLYSADGTSPKEQYATSIGDFVYVDGGFRYIDPQVFLALSAAPPLRIRLGGNVQAAKSIRKIAPIYPNEARKAGIEGAVVLHVLIGIDGTPKEVTHVSGDPLLSVAAIEAVRQWQYQPTLLNGTPVEVDTTVTVTFVLK